MSPPHLEPLGRLLDPSVKRLLEEQSKLISKLTEQVNSFASAPAKPDMAITHLSLKSLFKISSAYNNPQWITRLLWLLRAFVLKQPLSPADMRMSDKWSEEEQRGLLLNLKDDQKADDTLWTARKSDDAVVPMDNGQNSPDASTAAAIPTAEVSPVMVQVVEAPWALTYTAVKKYKEKYESDSSQSKQAAGAPEFTEGLTAAGARLKKVMAKRFKVVDGEEYFEVHRGEWVKSSSQPVGPCKTSRGKGKIVRH